MHTCRLSQQLSDNTLMQELQTKVDEVNDQIAKLADTLKTG